jgi:hypothetical protein
LPNHHIENGPGNKICTEDAATTRKISGTAKRTEYPIMCETPSPVERSVAINSTAMTMDIGIEMSQNKRQLLMALLFKSAFRFLLIDSLSLRENVLNPG